MAKENTTGRSTTKPVIPAANKQRKSFEEEMMKRNKAAQDAGKRDAKKAPAYAKGGSVSSRADGVAKKGRTKTKMVAMAGGGSCGMKKGK